ncbi:MAG TPA: hypothetical protein VLQ45_09025 [Thermoanaerobaculia bacterium]|nr:hypothetical protein [Thermoanaerobaculia bacterium]
MSNDRRIFAWAIGFSLLAASAAFASERQAVLGADGAVYVAKTGTYGQLFPGAKGTASDPVLALEVTRPDSPVQRILVPSTANSEVEKSPSLLYEDHSETLYLVWQSAISSIHPILQLSGFDGTKWSEPIEVTGNPFAPKTSPQMAITRDTFGDLDGDGELVLKHRTILHLIWEEEIETGGLLETFYTPILFIDGVYLGWNPVYRLSSFDPSEALAGAAGPGLSPALVRSPSIQSGRDGRTVVVAFVSPAKQRLISLEIDALPQEFSQLADKARSHIIDLGRRPNPPRGLKAIADEAQNHIVELGRAFHTEIAESLAGQVHEKILKSGTQDLTFLGGAARSHIIDLGAKLSGRGLRNPAKALAVERTEEIAPTAPGFPAPETPQSSNFIQFRLAGSRAVPDVGTASADTLRVFISESGDNVLIAWPDQNRVLYRDTKGEEWNKVREIKLSDGLDLSRAYEILERLVRNR